MSSNHYTRGWTFVFAAGGVQRKSFSWQNGKRTGRKRGHFFTRTGEFEINEHHLRLLSHLFSCLGDVQTVVHLSPHSFCLFLQTVTNSFAASMVSTSLTLLYWVWTRLCVFISCILFVKGSVRCWTTCQISDSEQWRQRRVRQSDSGHVRPFADRHGGHRSVQK